MSLHTPPAAPFALPPVILGRADGLGPQLREMLEHLADAVIVGRAIAKQYDEATRDAAHHGDVETAFSQLWSNFTTAADNSLMLAILALDEKVHASRPMSFDPDLLHKRFSPRGLIHKNRLFLAVADPDLVAMDGETSNVQAMQLHTIRLDQVVSID